MKRERLNWTLDRIITLALLAGAGGTSQEISEAMRVTPQAVRDAARRNGIPLPKRSAPACSVGQVIMVVKLPVDVITGLREAADTREIEVNDLVAELATVAGREGAGFIANVLDDRA